MYGGGGGMYEIGRTVGIPMTISSAPKLLLPVHRGNKVKNLNFLKAKASRHPIWPALLLPPTPKKNLNKGHKGNKGWKAAQRVEKQSGFKRKILGSGSGRNFWNQRLGPPRRHWGCRLRCLWWLWWLPVACSNIAVSRVATGPWPTGPVKSLQRCTVYGSGGSSGCM